MDSHERQEKEGSPGENLRQLFAALGDAFGEVFNDPELKSRAKDFGDAAADSAQQLGRRFKDEEVKERFRKAGEAAEEFGRSIAEYFKSDRGS